MVQGPKLRVIYAAYKHIFWTLEDISDILHFVAYFHTFKGKCL